MLEIFIRISYSLALYVCVHNLFTNVAVATDIPTEPRASIILDAVLASVDGVPITLSDLNKKLNRDVNYEQLSQDQEALKILEELVLKKVLDQEAESKKISVSSQDIESYLTQIAERNRLTISQLEQAIQREGSTLSNYREQIKYEIIKSQLAAFIMRGGITISDSEVDAAIKETSHKNSEDSAVTAVELRRIFLSKERSQGDRNSKIDQINSGIKSGHNFAELAQKFSDGPESQDGGRLGIIPETDLAPEIMTALAEVKDGDAFGPLISETGISFYQLIRRIDPDQDDEDLEEANSTERERVRKSLEQSRLQARLSKFFTEDLPRLHAVERKL